MPNLMRFLFDALADWLLSWPKAAEKAAQPAAAKKVLRLRFMVFTALLTKSAFDGHCKKRVSPTDRSSPDCADAAALASAEPLAQPGSALRRPGLRPSSSYRAMRERGAPNRVPGPNACAKAK